MGSVLHSLRAITTLQRSYKVYDPVHGFIRFNALEKKVIDSAAFQRLHSIHQLGMAYLVYPGATHTRFEHSLGTMELATQIFEKITSKGFALVDKEYWLQIVRLAALCHDLGHLPFSHDAEQALLGPEGHEGWTLKVIRELQEVWDLVAPHFPGKEVARDVMKMAVGEKKLLEPLFFSQAESVLSHIVTGDFFGADRIDYLLRDAKCTGVSHGLFDYDQLIEMLCVVSHEGKLQLAIEENGVESCEALLLARHFMHQRVYKYASVKAHKFHLSRFMKVFVEEGEYLKSLAGYLSLTDNEVLVALRKATQDPRALGYVDAVALLQREKRFRAIGLKEGIAPTDLGNLREELDIPEESLFIEPLLAKTEVQTPFFLVQTRASKAIVPSYEYSQIVFSPKPLRWIYIDPTFESLFCSRLGV
jgi:hypothetical protein